ncbi:hypothetical protein F53441_9713 [Fusarium austroafricanum]|uniref:Azaphilone pigments biosynthesis cluster protein L N-terminal domain-containing protein n=1 Tax=Fusarium austroafricanum TaxID=2364996 RepID=A0A8H4NW46_9HYPO|nr:hypothetical protein F53441_9713 [Fusarium austroafricanum]
MDPLSIVSGCAGLISTIGSLSLSINAFVRTCREARGDLDRVRRELLSLQTVLELIQEDASDEEIKFPKTLEHHVSGIVTNCNSVVVELQECITKYGGDNRLKTKAGWAINGQGDVTKLRSNLEAHKAALELALDMLAWHMAKEIKNDTTEIRNDTAAIKDDTEQILEEIARLQERLPKQVGNDYILQHFLEEMTTYTEKALDGGSIDGGNLSPRASATVTEEEEELEPPPEDAYLEEYERSSYASTESAYWRKQDKKWEEDLQYHLDNLPPEDTYKDELVIEEERRQAQLAEAQRPSTLVGESSSSQQGNKPPIASKVHHLGRQDGSKRREESSSTSNTHEGPLQLRLRKPAKSESLYDTDKMDVQQAHQRVQLEESTIISAHPDASQVVNTTVLDSSEERMSKILNAGCLFPALVGGRLVIDFSVPKSIEYRLPQGTSGESRTNAFTALMNSADLTSSALQSMRVQRSARVVFYFNVGYDEDEITFSIRWKFITKAIEGLSRWDKKRRPVYPEVYESPLWTEVIVLVEGPPRWQIHNPEVKNMLNDLGILPKTNDFVESINGVPLDRPYHTDHEEFNGHKVKATINEYTAPPCIRPRCASIDDITRTQPVQVIAVARRAYSSDDGASPGPNIRIKGWARSICKILKPQFVVALPRVTTTYWDELRPGEFLQKIWQCQVHFMESSSLSSNELVFTTPAEFLKDLDNLSKGAEGAKKSAWRRFRS